MDGSFNPGVGPNQDVLAIATQSDGKILMGGAFNNVDNNPRSRFARLNANGSLDPNFGLGSGANGAVRAIVVQPDNRILMGGDFMLVNGSFRQRIGRLMSDGSTDVSFTATVNGPVNAIAVQSNGRIVIGGAFTTVGGLPRASIARLNANGSVDRGGRLERWKSGFGRGVHGHRRNCSQSNRAFERRRDGRRDVRSGHRRERQCQCARCPG